MGCCSFPYHALSQSLPPLPPLCLSLSLPLRVSTHPVRSSPSTAADLTGPSSQTPVKHSCDPAPYSRHHRRGHTGPPPWAPRRRPFLRGAQTSPRSVRTRRDRRFRPSPIAQIVPATVTRESPAPHRPRASRLRRSTDRFASAPRAMRLAPSAVPFPRSPRAAPARPRFGAGTSASSFVGRRGAEKGADTACLERRLRAPRLRRWAGWLIG